MDGKNNNPEISIILPCRNEEQALPFCLKQIKETVQKNNLPAEIIVSDSSTDKSPEIAKKENVILVKHNKEGYGIAYLEAFKISKGKYIFMADADATYDFSRIPDFIKELRKGYDLVVGNRFSGKIEKGAMPWQNRFIGTPILSFILKLFFGAKIIDSQSGMRAIKKSSLDKLNLQTTGMEFASEMIVKAIKNKLKIKEIPVNYFKRKGKSKLRPFSDAYKHIRFMLLYSPLFLFFIPGIILFLFGAGSGIWIYFSSPQIFGIKLFYHPLFLSSAFLIIGYQLIIFSAFTKIYSITHLKEENKTLEKLFKYITIERAGIAGILICLAGAVIYFLIFSKWVGSGLSSLNEIKNSVVALTFMVLGAQTIFSAFMFSILGIKEK
ncbi:MAG: glycosyltransferase family 2 protein [Candidatus Staskawiczbacteria bacterium]|jgi:glycosyltransferase involved in cell wall biosynthesis